MNKYLLSTMTIPDEATCWNAVQSRDIQWKGQFVYAVHSTGIFCSPGCSSRQPRRDQVSYFASPVEALTAGYRPCKRCQPDKAEVETPSLETVRLACEILDANPEHSPSLRELSAQLHVSPAHLHRLFTKTLGLTPRQYAANQRMQQFRSHVRSGESLTEAIYAAGFSSSSRLYENATGHLGMTPAKYQRGGEGAVITYTTVDTSLGRLLVAATVQGICSVGFCEDTLAAEDILRKEYPHAQIKQDRYGLQVWTSAFVRYLEGEQQQLDLPLDVRATAFQLRVWQELRKIPYGQTRSYAQVAQSIGQPSATRAVARACATNPAALIIPCHRVVRSDHTPGGYRWGLERKQVLLDREHQNIMAQEQQV